MFKPKFKKRGLVRAVFVVNTGTGCTSTISREDAEEHGNIWAVGIWHRDDERNLDEKLEIDFNRLMECYKLICGNDFCGGAFTYEYKEYIH